MDSRTLSFRLSSHLCLLLFCVCFWLVVALFAFGVFTRLVVVEIAVLVLLGYWFIQSYLRLVAGLGKPLFLVDFAMKKLKGRKRFRKKS